MLKVIVFAFLCLLSFYSYAIELVTGQQSFEFHGYFRSSMGLSEHGESQALFQLPGARSKYRLGNEPDTNIELQLNYTFELKEPENKGANIQSVIMLDGYKRQGESNDFALDNLAQLYLSFNRLISKDTDIWFGRRYYQRKSIHIMNHFWLNPGQNSHVGIGFEHMPVGSGQLDLALFHNEDDFNLASVDYLINSTVIDARWYKNMSDKFRLTLWAQQAYREGVTALSYDDKPGQAVGGWINYQSNKFKNTTALMYQTGAAITQSDFNPRPVREDLGWNLDKANISEINNVLTYEALPDYSFQWSLLYRQDDRGMPANSDIEWLSTGIRPIFYFSKHVNLALEAGVDYVDDAANNRSGSLNKFTTALQIAADRGLKSRPVLRIFATVAAWDKDFKGLIGTIPGTAPYANDTSGWVIGAQAETWW